MAQLDLLPPATAHAHLPLMPHDNTSSHASSAPKANGAYKTISEVSEEIDVPQHVLRFWESHFPQVKPSRMRGSRRYYRPEDVDVLKTIKTLLYNKGYTIKGAKQVVRDGNVIANEVPIAAKPAPVVAAPVATPKAATTAAEKKNIDTKALVNELRVLKSMLTSLL